MDKVTDYKLLLDTAVLAGQIMIKNGSEIYRVEDTVQRILELSNFKTSEAFVTNTGFIATLDDPEHDSLTVVKRIHERKTDLNKIYVVNEISRELCCGKITLNEAFNKLNNINSCQFSKKLKYFCLIIIVMAFVFIFNGKFNDAIGAGIVQLVLTPVIIFTNRTRFNLFLQTVTESFIIALGAIAVSLTPMLKPDMSIIIISCIMPLVPGAALTSAIRDTLLGDYLAGGARALEAVVNASAIVIGTGLGLLLGGAVL